MTVVIDLLEIYLFGEVGSFRECLKVEGEIATSVRYKCVSSCKYEANR